jgi:hypothetical protein
MRRYPSGEVSVRFVLGLAVVAIAASCGAQSPAHASGSGLYGTVRVAPATPTCRAGSSCSRPARGFRLTFFRNGRKVATATTDARGRYRVSLDSGRYAVHAGRGTPPRKAALSPSRAAVPSGRFAKRDFTYDTGIR